MKTIEVRVQLPPNTHKKLKKMASDEGRTLGKQVTRMLKEIADKAK